MGFASSFFAELDFSVIWQYRLALLHATGMTCLLAVASLALATPLSVLLAIGKRSLSRPLRIGCAFFIEFWRGTPLLVQALWIHFALPLVTGLNTVPIVSGLIALTFNNSAYMAEIFRSGIDAIPAGQWEAAKALSLPGRAKWGRVVLPQALPIIVPPLTGFTISVIKGTAIVSILAITELMRVSTQINNVTFRPVEIFTFAAVVYLAIGSAVYVLGTVVEKYLKTPAGALSR